MDGGGTAGREVQQSRTYSLAFFFLKVAIDRALEGIIDFQAQKKTMTTRKSDFSIRDVVD